MKMRMTCLALLLCLLLTACGGKEPDSQGRTSLLGEAAGLEEEEVLVTVDGREVPAWRYLYWLAWTCGQMRERYESSGTVLDWDTPVSGGTLAQYVKDQALADTVLYAVVENLAEKAGYASSEEVGAKAALPDMGLDEAQMAQLEDVGRMYGWLYDRYCAGEGSLTPTQEELEAYGKTGGFLTLDRILIPAGEDREAARQRASEVFSRLNGAEDQGAAFSALAAEGGAQVGPRTLAPDSAELDGELLAAARELQAGQCSGILETQEGFSILRRLETDPEALKEPYFDDRLLDLAEAAEVTTAPAYDGVDPAAFDRAWEQARAEKNAP